MIFWNEGSRLLRVACLSVLGATLGYALLCAYVEFREQVIRSRSEALYAKFLAIRPGVTTKNDVDLLRRQWAKRLPEDVDCSGDQCDYTIGDTWGYSRWFLLTRYAHDHAPSSSLELEIKGNHVLRATFTAQVMVPAGYGTRAERESLSDPGYVPYSSGEYALIGRALLAAMLPKACCESPLPMPARGYRAQRVNCMNCLEQMVSALPSVPQETRARLFQFNFDCMTRWAVCTDKEDLMPVAAQEGARENAFDNEVEENQGKCIRSPEELAAAANDAVEIQMLSEPSSAGDLKVRVLRYIGGTRPLRVGQEMTLNVSRANNAATMLQQAQASGGKIVILYPGASYGFLYPYDQCGLLPDEDFETVSRNFELHAQ